MKFFKKSIKSIISKFGYRLISNEQLSKMVKPSAEKILGKEFHEILHKVNSIHELYGGRGFSSSYSLYNSLKYVIENKIEGDLVECGVFKGRSTAVMMETLIKNNSFSKNIYLYDTFEGMTKGSEIDYQINKSNNSYYKSINQKKTMTEGYNSYPIEMVKKNLEKFNYPSEKTIFVKGSVLKTLKNNLPNKISLLHLDTDFYDSSLYELEELYDLVVIGGVIIYDDYGSWMGQHKATNDFFNKKNLKPLLIRTSIKERVQIKL